MTAAGSARGPAALSVAVERWPLAEPFVISRGAKTEAVVTVVTATRYGHSGRGESVPYARYGESIDSVLGTIRSLPEIASRTELAAALPAGAARNAIDCAMWDLEAKEGGLPAARACGLDALRPVETCYTLSLGTPESMAAKARAVAHLALLKLKLGGVGDDERMAAVRAARPDARLVADANEAWTPATMPALMAAAAAARLELIEQPLPAGGDALLAETPRTVPVCADESAHTAADIPRLLGLYDAVNIKLDKAGGLTGALEMAAAARRAGLAIMTGSMVGTSLAVAPAFILAQQARWVDIDGPLLLSRDRDHGLAFRNGLASPPERQLWG